MEKIVENINIDQSNACACQSCGTVINDNYCPHCGQRQQQNILPFKDFIKEALEDFISVDFRIFKTLKKLLFNPGYLTEAYISGKRTIYVAPVKLYLVISVIYFTVLAFVKSNTLLAVYTPSEEYADIYIKWFPRLMFLAMPYFALILKILFIKSKKFYVEHLVFSLHYYSFHFITVIMIAFIRKISGLDNASSESIKLAMDSGNMKFFLISAIIIDSILQFIPLFYLIVGIRKIYGQSIFISSIKGITLVISQLLFFFGILSLISKILS